MVNKMKTNYFSTIEITMTYNNTVFELLHSKCKYTVWPISLHSPTTFSTTGWPMGGVVEIWHSYTPVSLFWANRIRSVHSSVCGECIASNRWSDVYVYRPTVSRWMSRCRTHDTCKEINITKIVNFPKRIKKNLCHYQNKANQYEIPAKFHLRQGINVKSKSNKFPENPKWLITVRASCSSHEV